eukprot:2796085-Rhodomonas_salina.1
MRLPPFAKLERVTQRQASVEGKASRAHCVQAGAVYDVRVGSTRGCGRYIASRTNKYHAVGTTPD